MIKGSEISSAEPTTHKPESPRATKTGAFFKTRIANSNETGFTIIEDEENAVFFRSDSSAITGDTEVIDKPPERHAPVTRLYPHWEDDSTETGLALKLLQDVSRRLDAAAEAGVDEPGSLNHIVRAEGMLFQALKSSRFHRPFEMAISFCAWALRNVGGNGKGIPSLQGMTSALRNLEEQPLLSLSQASTLIRNLEKQGWSGQSPIEIAFRLGLARATVEPSDG